MNNKVLGIENKKRPGGQTERQPYKRTTIRELGIQPND